jgi:uncharacterized protein
MKELLKRIIFDQQSIQWNDRFIKRSINEGLLYGDEIVVISGIRRCGKSTLLNQLREELPEHDYYMNFDDERLINFSVHDFQLLQDTFMELFGIQKTYYFDEIQNIQGWERFVRRLHDMGNKVFVTGSNATMLSRELGTHLTGRFCKVELFPFSFREFTSFKGKTLKEVDFHSGTGRASLQRLFNDYTKLGGFPGYLKNNSPEYLRTLYESIIYRDVMVRNHLTGEKELLELVYYLASNVAKLSSYSSLSKVAGVKNASTIKSYLDFLQNAYLLFQVCKYDYSLNKQLQNARKTYFIDHALVSRLGFLFSSEKGRILENIIFVELQRRGEEVYYHRNLRECDFIIKQGVKITGAIQVCHSFESTETRQREIKGLIDAMDNYNLNKGLIITDSVEEQIETEGKTISFVPAWRWAISDNR